MSKPSRWDDKWDHTVHAKRKQDKDDKFVREVFKALDVTAEDVQDFRNELYDEFEQMNGLGNVVYTVRVPRFKAVRGGITYRSSK